MTVQSTVKVRQSKLIAALYFFDAGGNDHSAQEILVAVHAERSLCGNVRRRSLAHSAAGPCPSPVVVQQLYTGNGKHFLSQRQNSDFRNRERSRTIQPQEMDRVGRQANRMALMG